MRGLFVAGGDDLTCVLGGVVHDGFLTPHEANALGINFHRVKNCRFDNYGSTSTVLGRTP